MLFEAIVLVVLFGTVIGVFVQTIYEVLADGWDAIKHLAKGEPVRAGICNRCLQRLPLSSFEGTHYSHGRKYRLCRTCDPLPDRPEDWPGRFDWMPPPEGWRPG